MTRVSNRALLDTAQNLTLRYALGPGTG
jgi:hypothetical protein